MIERYLDDIGGFMDIFVIVQQMLVLLCMMILGIIACKVNWIDDYSYGKLSKIVVNILNPCLMISGIMGKDAKPDGTSIVQNIILVFAYFALLILVSKPIVKLLRVKKSAGNVYQLMLIFSNIGFMGIPVITSIYGTGAMIYIVFYNIAYNTLLYSYAFYVASDNGDAEGGKQSFSLKNFANPGFIACFVTIFIYLTGWTFPDSVGSFFSYVGNSVVPFSMFLIGASFVQNGKKEFFTDIKIYLFMAIKMLVIPIAAAIAIRYIPGVKDWNPTMLGIFILMLSMPVGSMIVMISKQCGADDVEATKGGIFTTLLSVVTIPIVGFFLPM